MNVNLGLSH